MNTVSRFGKCSYFLLLTHLDSHCVHLIDLALALALVGVEWFLLAVLTQSSFVDWDQTSTFDDNFWKNRICKTF
jgi:hypothetical protein